MKMRCLLSLVLVVLFFSSCNTYWVEQRLDKDTWTGETKLSTKIYFGDNEVWVHNDYIKYLSKELVRKRKAEADSLIGVYKKLGL